MQLVSRGVIACLLAIAAAVVPAAAAQPGGSAVASEQTPAPTPTPSPGPEASPPASADPTLHVLNPAAAGPPALPVVTDRPAGGREGYRLVAFVDPVPRYAVVEATFIPWSNPVPQESGWPTPIPSTYENEAEIGLMAPTALDPRVFELFWDVPDRVPNGYATIVMRVYEHTVDGPVERAANSIDVRLSHHPEVEEHGETNSVYLPRLTWPGSTVAELGFYRSRSSAAVSEAVTPTVPVWASVVDASFSAGDLSGAPYQLSYTTDPLNGPLTFTSCSVGRGTIDPGGGPDKIRTVCELDDVDAPSRVTALQLRSQQTTDVVVIRPYLQNTKEMRVSLVPNGTARTLPPQCVEYHGTVVDRYDRLVPYVNVDVHLRGPADEVAFGTSLGSVPSDSAVPGGHRTEARRVCGSFDPWTSPNPDQKPPEQATHRVPSAPDTKHLEFFTVRSANSPSIGKFSFTVFSPYEGAVDVHAWIDDSPLVSDSVSRLPDDDRVGENEPEARAKAFWYAQVATLEMEQERDASRPGECVPVTVRARSESTPVSGVNVDVHVSSEGGHGGFCDPPGASARRAPDKGAHDGASDRSASPPAVHTEGETDERGNFLVGVTSSQVGTANVVAWIDGEPRGAGFANDDDNRAGGEASAELRHTWGSASRDANVRLISPSAVGSSGAPAVSNARDANGTYHLLARVDAPSLVPAIDFSFAPPGSTTFAAIGSAERIGASDVYALDWDTTHVAPGNYVVRSQIPGTDRFDEITVALDNRRQAVALSGLADGATIGFDRRSAAVTGVASAAAAGVDVYYATRTGLAADQPQWQKCGSVTFPAGADRGFSVACSLAARTRPAQVAAVAAVALFDDCSSATGCVRQTHAADVRRLDGVVTQPVVSLEPYRHEATTGDCRRMVVEVVDERGDQQAGVDVDVELVGPAADGIRFCDPMAEGQTPPTEGSSERLHLEGSTDEGGVFVFGAYSEEVGDSEVVAWVDEVEDDARGADEPHDTALIHWVEDDECTQVGTKGSDVLVGGPGPDKLCGRGGDDVLRGGGGDDILVGGPGGDSLHGGGGDDVLYGGRSGDLLEGGEGDDECVAGPGADRTKSCEGGDEHPGKPPV